METTEMIPAIIATLLGIGGPVAIVIIAIIYAFKRRKKQNEAILKALEIGKTPEEIQQSFMIKKKKNGVIGFLRGGIVVAGIGLGLFFMGLILEEIGLFASAALILTIGVALVLVYFIAKPKDSNENH